MAEQNALSNDVSAVREVLLLEGMEGVGRVTTRKVLGQFRKISQIADLPREQALNRLKGVPNAAGLLDRLTDDDLIEAAGAAVDKRLQAWTNRGVRLQTFADSSWPVRLDGLPNPHRPNILYEYGDADLVRRPSVAFVARGELREGPFEVGQRLLRRLCDRRIRASVGASTGFDVVAVKLGSEAGVPPVLVASCGLARIPQSMRAHASAVVKSGGLMLSSFAMDHGPFEHDAREASMVQTALARVVVFVDPAEGDFHDESLQWAMSTRMPVFAITDRHLPNRVHLIQNEIDMEWVVAAIEHVGK